MNLNKLKAGYSSGEFPVSFFWSRLILILFFSVFCLISEGQTNNPEKSIPNELTVYVIPSASPLFWDSPASLYKSFFKGYMHNFLKKEKYLLGHLFVRLNTPLLDSTLFAGIASASKKEKRILYTRDKVGMGILGVALKGKMDTREGLEKKIKHYSRKNQLSFITYRISEEAAKRIIEFYGKFNSQTEFNFSPSEYYGGAFWPRYENEGAGCTAFGISMLDVAGLLGDESELWRVSVNIPMNIIGGECNNNLKVKNRVLTQSKQWWTGPGTADIDYVPFWIYDPTYIFNWIRKQRNLSPENQIKGFIPTEQGNIPGLYIDKSSLVIDNKTPVFLKRPDNFFFLKPYFNKVGYSPDTSAAGKK